MNVITRINKKGAQLCQGIQSVVGIILITVTMKVVFPFSLCMIAFFFEVFVIQNHTLYHSVYALIVLFLKSTSCWLGISLVTTFSRTNGPFGCIQNHYAAWECMDVRTIKANFSIRFYIYLIQNSKYLEHAAMYATSALKSFKHQVI